MFFQFLYCLTIMEILTVENEIIDIPMMVWIHLYYKDT